MAIAFSICVLTSISQANVASQSQVVGLGVALFVIFLLCAKGFEMYSKQNRLLRGRGMREAMGRGRKGAFYGKRDTTMQDETMTLVQAQPIPPMGPTGKKQQTYFREGADIQNAMTLQNIFNFNTGA